ncbi:hypothetical protein BJ508DRAFT_230692 [Ascobolus immersus RN42]|uniref:Ubiquinol-cytochrome c chaperone domain-containing protein n=1 Tax=Ascobolus immersus RN42 TaxID=1160509 RepID=A0A3N4HR62_ASCIM|nr:hypothetical protein BJ508DRAFT_230692 [Ascobolus immersus RN42]
MHRISSKSASRCKRIWRSSSTAVALASSAALSGPMPRQANPNFIFLTSLRCNIFCSRAEGHLSNRHCLQGPQRITTTQFHGRFSTQVVLHSQATLHPTLHHNRAEQHSLPPTMSLAIHRRLLTSQSRHLLRSLSTTQVFHQTPTPEVPQQKPALLPSQNSIFRKAAGTIRQALPGTTETYVAYNITKQLYLECAKQGDYGVIDLAIKASGKDKKKVGKSIQGTGMGASMSDLPLVALGEEDKVAFWYHGMSYLYGLESSQMKSFEDDANGMAVCKREKTFNSWAQVTLLHIWMLCARFRTFPREKSKVWQHHLVDHFFFDAEEKMVKGFDMTNGSLRTRYLKDMFVQYRGMVAALDEGLFKDDPTLASAIWRNVFDASENVDLEHLTAVVSYVRRCLHGLDKVSDDTVEKGLIYFGNPADEIKTVQEPSKRLNLTE